MAKDESNSAMNDQKKAVLATRNDLVNRHRARQLHSMQQRKVMQAKQTLRKARSGAEKAAATTNLQRAQAVAQKTEASLDAATAQVKTSTQSLNATIASNSSSQRVQAKSIPVATQQLPTQAAASSPKPSATIPADSSRDLRTELQRLKELQQKLKAAKDELLIARGKVAAAQGEKRSILSAAMMKLEEAKENHSKLSTKIEEQSELIQKLFIQTPQPQPRAQVTASESMPQQPATSEAIQQQPAQVTASEAIQQQPAQVTASEAIQQQPAQVTASEATQQQPKKVTASEPTQQPPAQAAASKSTPQQPKQITASQPKPSFLDKVFDKIAEKIFGKKSATNNTASSFFERVIASVKLEFSDSKSSNESNQLAATSDAAFDAATDKFMREAEKGGEKIFETLNVLGTDLIEQDVNDERELDALAANTPENKVATSNSESPKRLTVMQMFKDQRNKEKETTSSQTRSAVKNSAYGGNNFLDKAVGPADLKAVSADGADKASNESADANASVSPKMK